MNMGSAASRFRPNQDCTSWAAKLEPVSVVSAVPISLWSLFVSLSDALTMQTDVMVWQTIWPLQGDLTG
jgi:hypothetical protein